jgi:hypothetical protein
VWEIVFLIVDTPRLALALFMVVFIALIAIFLLRGSRVAWTLLVASGVVGLLMAPFESSAWWNVVLTLVSLGFLLAPSSRRFVWRVRSNWAPKQRQQTTWDPESYSDQDRPAGWYVESDAPGRMRYWHAEQGAWMGTTKTPRKIRRQLDGASG